MSHSYRRPARVVLSIALIAFLQLPLTQLYAGGPWTLGKGKSEITLGFSRKHAGLRWTPTDLDNNGTPSDGTDDTWGPDTLSAPSNTIDGLFHDFRYYYLGVNYGITDRLQFISLFTWLNGWEVATTNPNTGQPLEHYEWEINRGLVDFWLGLKYQILKGKFPVALEFNSRFPDMYSKDNDIYTRYDWKYVTNMDGTRDSIAQPAAEWRGIKKRDFTFILHSGTSFAAGKGWTEAYVGYSFRQGALADQLLAGIGVGYNITLIPGKLKLAPKGAFYLEDGMSNGNTPDLTDRFAFNFRRNYYFNDPTHGRLYGSLNFNIWEKLDIQGGVGYWIFGSGCPQYTENFIQATYTFGGKKC